MSVTVNGLPLKEFTDKETAKEIEEVRESATKPIRQSIVTKHNGNHSGERSGRGQIIWTNGQKATHVLVCGQLFDWAAKAPYVMSGYSIYGAAEYCERTKEFKCHECGEWFAELGHHISPAHKMPAREYRQRHGFKGSRAIITPEKRAVCKKDYESKIAHFDAARKAVAESGFSPHRVGGIEKQRKLRDHRTAMFRGMVRSPEMANLRHKCIAQREDLIRKLYIELRSPLSMSDLNSFKLPDNSHPLETTTLRRMFGAPISKVLLRLGIPMWGRKVNGPRSASMEEFTRKIIAARDAWEERLRNPKHVTCATQA